MVGRSQSVARERASPRSHRSSRRIGVLGSRASRQRLADSPGALARAERRAKGSGFAR